MLMLSDKRGLAILAIALLAITAAVPAASASNITTVVSPSSNSANVTAYVNTSVEVKSNSSTVQLVESVLNNVSSSGTVRLDSSSPAFIGVQNAIQNNTTSARLTYLSLNMNLSTKKVSSVEFFMNYSLKIVMNLTGIYHNGTFDLKWRGFYDNNSINRGGVNYNKIQLGNETVNEYSAFNFTAFSKPLTEWQKNYNQALNVTTFTTNAGTTFNGTFNRTVSNGPFGSYYLNMTIKSDPSYTIVTPGYATASQDSITLTKAPGISSMAYLYGIAAAAIVAIGIGVSVWSRRRSRR